MILDAGICSIFRKVDGSAPGEMPRAMYSPVGRSWYGLLSFETSPARTAERREELKTDARVRIIQNRSVKQNDIAVLCDLSDFADRPENEPVYRITRAFHGKDDTGPELITDLSLEVYLP